MNKNQIIYDSLSEKKQVDFLLSCQAKYKNLYGVPRILIDSKTNFKNFFNTPPIDFENKDKIYFNIINNNDLDEFLNNFSCQIIFDTARVYFYEADQFFQFLNSDIKKLFNLNQREIEREKFLKTNYNHYKNEENIVTQTIKKKLNEVWQSKWSICESYLDDQNVFINNISHG